VQDRPATVVRVRFRLPGRLWLVILPVVLVAPLALLLGTGYVYGPSPPVAVDLSGLPEEAASLRREAERLRGEGRRIDARLRRTAPASAYIVIDHNENRLHLRKGDRLLRTVIVSCGSGRVLEEQGGQNRVWVFNTPLGLHRVLYKKADPVWKKPDWAFIEEGEPIPEDPSLRFEYGALGEYGLYFGDGYLIHGTLYERLLGRSVTHGCVRVGKDDLRELFYAVPLGTPIFIH
jgi:L,D-transpeptidase YbiS